MIELIDTPWSICGKGAAIKAAGKAGVIRYISPNTTNFPQKRLESAEIGEAAAHGLWLGAVWEVMGDLSEMTPVVGKSHGWQAVFVAKSLGIPKGTILWFAVDFDAGPSALNAVKSYFASVRVELEAAGYLVGGYGDMYILDQLFDLGIIHQRWRAGAGGWTDNKTDAGAAIDQTDAGNVTVAGLSVDLDELTGVAAADPAQAGLWLPKAA